MKIIKMLAKNTAIKCPYTMTPTRIVVHNTSNDASARNEVTYMNNNNKKVSFHYAVDDIEVVQAIEENRNSWNAGDGNGKGNREGIAIEICYSKSGGDRFIKAEQNAVDLIVDILKRYKWDISKVTKHQDYSKKYCPHRTLDMGWNRFIDMIKARLTPVVIKVTPVVKTNKYVVNTTTNLNCRASNSIWSKIVSSYKPKTIINVLEIKSGWGKVEYAKGKFGWVSMQWLKKA
jgi:N-acetylmuramoyl-L-alanine amidase CwlA